MLPHRSGAIDAGIISIVRYLPPSRVALVSISPLGVHSAFLFFPLVGLRRIMCTPAEKCSPRDVAGDVFTEKKEGLQLMIL